MLLLSRGFVLMGLWPVIQSVRRIPAIILFGQSQTSKQSKCGGCGVREAQDDVHHVGSSAWADRCSDTTMQTGGTDFTTSSKFPQGQRRMFAVCTTKILERLQAPEERVTPDRSPSADFCGGVECSGFESSRY